MSTEKRTDCPECGSDFNSYKAMRVHQSRTGHMDKPWRDKEKLETLYIDKGYSAYEISEMFGCGATAIYTALDYFDIERRPQADTKRLKASRQPANFRTHQRDGYEEVYTQASGGNQIARVHRLCAVAWHGYDAVAGSVVHHEIPIEWLNTEWNLEIKDNQSDHAKEHSQERTRNSEGQYV